QHRLDEIGGGEHILQGAPGLELFHQIGKAAVGAALEEALLDGELGGAGEGQPGAAADLAQLIERALTKAALWQVIDALKGKIVVGLMDDAEVGQHVANLPPLIKAKAADHPVADAKA